MNGKGAALAVIFSIPLVGDINRLSIHAGVHAQVLGYHRSLSQRFPFAIYYRVEADVVSRASGLDCRRKPSWIRRRLGGA